MTLCALLSCFVNSFSSDNRVYAESYTASLSGAGQVDISLSGDSSSDTSDSTITANTTCPNGYTILINGANDNETDDFNLYLDGDDSSDKAHFATSSGTLINPVALSANSWGILVNNGLYSGLSTTPVEWFSIATGGYTPGVDSNHIVTYGAAQDGSMSAGAYTMANNGRIVYTLEMDNTCTSYTVSFDANEPTGAPAATGTMSDQTITEGVATPLTANAYEVTGYVFTGWNTSADGSGTSYADGASVTNLAAANTTVTLYAQWAQNIIQNYARCPYLSTGDTELLTDIRDGKTYWIAKMADDHCWMTQNLDLDLETAPSQVAALTSENTDLNDYDSTGYTAALGYSQDSTTDVITWTPVRDTVTKSELDASHWAVANDYFSMHSFDPGDYYYTDQFEPPVASPGYNYLVTDNPTYVKTTPYAGNGVHGYVGNYYTWSAAIASNDTSGLTTSTYGNVGNNPKNSICPAGWRLPLTTNTGTSYTTPGSLNEVTRLNYVLNGNNNVTNSAAKLEAEPFYMTRAGYVDVGGIITRGGRGSGIWTSTVTSRTDSKTLYEGGTSVNAPSDSDRNGGYPVRCVSRDEATLYRSVSFQANEPAGAGTATGTMTPQSIADGFTATLKANAFELAGYIFNGWNTSADGTGTSYANEASITPTADITLYAQWIRSYSLVYDFGSESFDGASILDTKIALFDTNTVDKDFKITFGISNVTPVSGQNDNFNNFAAAMSETGQPYPGFALRFKSTEDATKYKFVANATTNTKYDSGTTYFNDADGAIINRKSGLMYLNSINEPVLDFNQLGSPFNATLTFGAGINGSGNPFRFANADLTDIQVKIEYANADTVTLPSPTKTGDTFLYWSTVADGTGTNYSAGTTITITGAVTLYPIWQSTVPVVTHDVTFLVNAPTGAPTPTGSMPVQTIAEGVATNLDPNNFAINGYNFTGWNTSADGTGTPYTDEASVTLTDDLTLYAQWILVAQHTLTFDFGNESLEGNNYYIDTKIKLFGSELINKDFELSFGLANPVWLTGQTGNFNNIANSMNESGNPYPGFVVRFNQSNVTNNQYNFNANAKSNVSANANVNNATSTGFKLERKSGYAYLNNSQTAAIDFNQVASPFDTPLTFGAGLNGSSQPFRYSKVDLSNIKLTFTFNNVDTYTLPSPTKTNDTFMYWNTAADGSGTTYAAGTTVTMSDDLTLYPIWLNDVPVTTHSVTFLVNAPTGAPTPSGTMANQTIPENVATNLNANTYAINGYAFTGWNTQADGQGTPYADEASVTLTDDLTLYAQWDEVVQHTLKFDFGDESFDGTNYLDTNIKLFSSALNSKDFDLSLSMGSATFVANSDNMDNIVTAMSEAGQPYPGFVVRYGSSNSLVTKYNFIANASTSSSDKVTQNNLNNADGFRLQRINGELYLNGGDTSVVNFNHLQNTFDSPLVFGAGLNGSNQIFRHSKIDLSDIELTITFNNTDTVILPTPVKSLYAFTEWNTAADGTGTGYNAGDTVTMSSDLTLYPIWELDVDTYEVTFHANEPAGTATGSMPNQTFYDGFEDNLNTNTFALTDYIFLGWNTAADGSGTDYADGAAITLNADLDLYAKWYAVADLVNYNITYNFGNETFDGTNYLNTHIPLFDDANIDRTFDIDFSVDSYTADSSQDKQRNAVVTAQNEGDKDNYPGFVLRYITSASADKKYSFAYYSVGNTKGKIETAEPTLPTSVSISRENKILSYNNSVIQGFDYTNISNTFDRPLMFGASINEDETGLYRYFTGSLSNISVVLTYNNLETVTIPTPEKPNYTFVEWNTSADGSGTSYTGGSTFTPSANLTLYPIWDHIVPVVNEYHEINLTRSRSASSETIDLTDMGMGSNVEFRSSNTAVATVNASGTVTAVAPGEATITVTGDKKAYYNVYVSEPNVPLFNITPEPIQIYYNSRDAWDVTKTKTDFLANMRETFESYNCKIYNYTDNSGRLDSAIAYGWTDGTDYCDQSRAYDTGQTGTLNVYLYDTNTSQPTGNALAYTGAVAGKIYNMIPGQTYYWELASDSSTNGYVKATGKHRILNLTQGDNSRVSGSQITRNTREIGGLPVDTNYDGTIDGYTKYGRIFRGERLWTSNGYNTSKLADLGANFEVDVRGSGEGTTDSRLVGYANRTVVQYQIKQGVDTSNYNTMRNVVTQTMQNVINGDNVYFHCSYGSDRTGSLAWILEGLLGVTDEDRLGDYELSTFYGAVDRNRYFEYEGSNTKRFTYMMTFLQTGQNVYDWYMYGTSDRAADEALINNFRTAMINYNS